MKRGTFVAATLMLSLTAGVIGAQTISRSAPAPTASAQASVAQSFQAEADMYRLAAANNRQLANAVAAAPSSAVGGSAPSAGGAVSGTTSGATSSSATASEAIGATQYNKIAALADTLASNAQKAADFHSQLAARLQVEQGTAQ